MIYRGSQMTLENVRPAKDYILVKFKKAAGGALSLVERLSEYRRYLIRGR